MKSKKVIFKKLTIKLEPNNLFSFWAHGIKIKLQYIIGDNKMTKDKMRSELKEIIKLFN